MIDGRILRIVRHRRGLTQEALAELSKVGVLTIKRIEKSDGAYRCNGPTVERLARALVVEVDLLTNDVFNEIMNVGADLAIHMSGRPINIEGLRKDMDELLERCVHFNKMREKIKFPEGFKFEEEIPDEAVWGPYKRLRFTTVVDLSENSTIRKE
jgi:transcriptional regulator with XRE-family HTH domain